MLDAVSCWYFDWATVGTWVGGLGAAAAAWAAVWTVKQAAKRRAKFAAYLFDRDLAELRGLLPEIKDIVELLCYLDDPNPSFESYMQANLEASRKQVMRTVMQFKYFSSEAEQFEYRPECQEFSELVHIYRELLDLDRSIDQIWDEHGIEVSAQCTEDTRKRLEKALQSWDSVHLHGEPKVCSWCLLRRLLNKLGR